MPRSAKSVTKQSNPGDILCMDVESRLKGIPTSPGIAIGKCMIMRSEDQDVLHSVLIKQEEREKESDRYSLAVKACVLELRQTFTIAEQLAGNVSAILESYEMIMTDGSLNASIRERIASGYSAESAITIEYDTQKNFFKSARDSILRARAYDLENVKHRVLLALHNKQTVHSIARSSIVIAANIIPQDVVLFNESEVLAYVTEVGGISSHSSILARSLNLPAVIGVKSATNFVTENSLVIVDGYEGLLIANPKPETIERYEKKRLEKIQQATRLAKIAKLPSQTSDGHQVSLMANLDTSDDVDTAFAHGADGVGLVRTEMFIVKLDRFPNEDEQTEWYASFAERSFPNPVTLRAFDLGSDKFIEGLPHEKNPALGVRGVRFLLSRKDLFRIQIRAVLRASRTRNVRFLIPMITRISEIDEVIEMIELAKLDLDTRGEDFDKSMPLGIMIETPASALLADKFAQKVDFFSIGTNDLTQYALAADRTSELVGNIFDAFDPAVLRLMKHAVDAAKSAGIKVSVCGEFGAHSAATELLIGMGIDELSVNHMMLPELKKRVRKSTLSRSMQIFDEVMNCVRPSDVRRTVAAVKKKK